MRKFVEKTEDRLIGYDFASMDSEDYAVKCEMRLSNGVYSIISTEILGKAKDFDTAKINEVLFGKLFTGGIPKSGELRFIRYRDASGKPRNGCYIFDAIQNDLLKLQDAPIHLHHALKSIYSGGLLNLENITEERPLTEDECETLQENLASKGKQWNFETSSIEEIPKPEVSTSNKTSSFEDAVKPLQEYLRRKYPKGDITVMVSSYEVHQLRNLNSYEMQRTKN